MRRALAVVFLGLLAALFVSQAVIKTAWFQTEVQQRVRPLVFELLNMTVSWEELRINPLQMQVELLGLRAYSGAATTGTPFLQTPRVTAQVSLTSLFIRTLEIDPIRVERPIVRFARDDNKWINFLDIDKIDELASAEGDGTGWKVIVRRLILIDGDADFVLTPIDLRAHLTGLNVTGHFDSLSEHDRIPIEVHQAHGLYRMFGRDFQLGDITGNLSVEMMEGSAVDLLVDLTVLGAYPNARLKASGRIVDLTETHIFHLKAHGETETNFLNDIFFDQPQLTGSAALSISYDGDFKEFKVGGRVTSHSLLVNDVNITEASADVAVTLHEFKVTESSLKAFGGQIKASGKLDLDRLDWKLKLLASDIEPKELNVLTQALPRLKGSITAGFEGEGTLHDAFPFSGSLVASSPGLIVDWGQEFPLALPDSELKVALNWDGEELEIVDGQVTTSREEIGFAGSFWPDDGSIDVSLALQSGDLSVLQVITKFPMSGWGTGDGTWTGTLSEPVLHFDFDLRDTNLPWFSADVASGGIDVTTDEVRLTDVTAETQKGSVWLRSGQITHLGSAPEIDIRVDAHDVPLAKTLRPLLKDKVPIDGRFTGQFVLSSPLTAPTGYAEGQIVDAVVWGERIEYVEGRLDIHSGVLQFDALRGRQGNARYTASGRVEPSGPVSVSVRGDHVLLHQINYLREYAIAGTGTALLEVRIASPEAESVIDLNWNTEQVSVSGVRLGNVTGELHKIGEDLAAIANAPGITAKLNMALLSGYPATITVAVAGLDVMPFMKKGVKDEASLMIGGKAEIRGLLSKWRESSGRIVVDSLKLQQGRTQIGNDGPLYLTLRNGKFQLDRVALIGDNTSATFRGAVSLDGVVDIQLAGGIELQFFTLFVDELKAASGRLEADGTIQGTLQDPNIQATLRVKGGRLQLKSVNLLLEDLQLSGIFENQQILLDNMQAQIGAGTMSGGGVIKMDGFVPTSVSLYTTLNEAEARIPSWMLARVNGRIELIGPMDDVLMRGELEIVRAVYDERLDWETLVLRFKPRPFEPVRVAKTKGFHLDIGLHSAGSIFVKNNLADLKLRGDLRVVGYPPDIGITGNLQFVSGNVVFRENVFSIVNGQVNFTEEQRVRPFIDLQAKTRVQEIAPNGGVRYDDITVSVSGPPDNLQITLESSPPLSREDILSLLYIKRRTTEDIGGGETATAEAVSLAFKVNEELAGFQSEVQDYFGFEQLILEPAFTETTRSGTMRLRAIKILSKDLTAELKTSLSSTDLDLRLGYSITENVFMDFGWNSVPEDQVQSNASTFGNFKVRPRLHFEFQ